MNTAASSFTARNNAKRAAEKMIANGKAPAVDYGIRPRDDGRCEIVWKTVPTTGEVETEIATAATAAEDGHYSTNPRLSVHEDPGDAPPNAGAEEVAAATGNEPAASSVPASGAPERDNKWPNGTRVMVRNKPKSWSEATIHTRLDAEYWRVKYPSGGTGTFKGGDIRAYDAQRDAKRANQPRRARATEPRAASRSRYALDPAVRVLDRAKYSLEKHAIKNVPPQIARRIASAHLAPGLSSSLSTHTVTPYTFRALARRSTSGLFSRT
jgi:hypothetical protein